MPDHFRMKSKILYINVNIVNPVASWLEVKTFNLKRKRYYLRYVYFDKDTRSKK